ncbi:MAG: GNAT family N-acetyltransferase [Terracidiphilus sp.]
MRDTIRTERLLLRRWRDSDRLPFQAMNADQRVMEFMPARLSPEDSDALIVRAERHFERHGFGPFAVQLLDKLTFAGFIGLSIPAFDAPFMPAVEVGWRLAFDCWGALPARDGKDRHDARSSRRLRPPTLAGRSPAPPPRALSHQPLTAYCDWVQTSCPV